MRGIGIRSIVPVLLQEPDPPSDASRTPNRLGKTSPRWLEALLKIRRHHPAQGIHGPELRKAATEQRDNNIDKLACVLGNEGRSTFKHHFCASPYA